MGMGKVFISYRREGGAEMARLLRDRLQQRGYGVFLDVEELRSGLFDEALVRQIEVSTDVVVILSPGSLDGCHAEDDWLRREVAHAIAHGKNIVPILMRGFQWPKRPLPEDMAALPQYNGLAPSLDFFDASMDRLSELLVGRPRRRLLRQALVATVASGAIVAALVIAVILLTRRPQPHKPLPSDDPSEVVLAGGKLMFRTERLAPVAGPAHHEDPAAEGVTAGEPGHVSELELAFQILNKSSDTVTLSSLQVTRIGLVVVYEDVVAVKPPDFPPGLRTASAMNIQGARTDLVLLGEDAALSGDRSLLSSARLEAIQPNTVRSFLLRLRCRNTDEDGVAVEPPGPGRAPDSASLEALDVKPPQPIAVAHVFMAVADVLAEGARHRLYSDWVYVLYPAIGNRLPTARRGSVMPLRRWYGLPPREFTHEIIGWSVKTYRDTLAYQFAKRSLPSNFDADSVSPYCYFRDRQSPFRRLALTSAPELQHEGDTFRAHARSTIVDVFAAASREHPPVWRLIRAEIERLHADPSARVHRKARYVWEELHKRGVVAATEAGAPAGK